MRFDRELAKALWWRKKRRMEEKRMKKSTLMRKTSRMMKVSGFNLFLTIFVTELALLQSPSIGLCFSMTTFGADLEDDMLEHYLAKK